MIETIRADHDGTVNFEFDASRNHAKERDKNTYESGGLYIIRMKIRNGDRGYLPESNDAAEVHDRTLKFRISFGDDEARTILNIGRDVPYEKAREIVLRELLKKTTPDMLEVLLDVFRAKGRKEGEESVKSSLRLLIGVED